VKYYKDGKPYYESTHSDKLVVAQRLLRLREGETAKGQLPGVVYERVFFTPLAEDFLTDYRVNRRKSLDKAGRSVRYLKGYFGVMRVTDITTAKIKAYIEQRMSRGLSNASINRELGALKRIFHLAAQSTPPKVNHIPYIPMLKESNVRRGFFEYAEFVSLRNALPLHLKPLVTFAYYTGWRKAEILNLTWNKVDLKEGIVRLDPGETKNEEGRTVYMNEELLMEMRILHSKRRLGCPFVFHHEGNPIKDFRGSWDSACKQVGLKGRLFHDFRRTAVRNMVRSGISERVAMARSGHKTRSVFERYNIVSEQDQKEAAIKLQAFINAQDQSSYTLVIPEKKIAFFDEKAKMLTP